jgi:proteasome beta subunit
VNVPLFSPGDDPGPNFVELLLRLGATPPALAGPTTVAIPHGTTVVAMRYGDGVLMAGDRRATSGNIISHRAMEKVFPADSHSVVGIAGAAGPAVELVRLFQLQLEHYEKVEGTRLSIEGKANQLSAMIRGNLPAAMQGLVVVPLFAGYDEKRGTGRLFEYDITGGRYEERDYAATGSGSIHAGTAIKLGYQDGLTRDQSIDLAVEALFHAADEDSATGGPDLMRGIFPVVATVERDGYVRQSDTELERRTTALLERLRSRRGGLPS